MTVQAHMTSSIGRVFVALAVLWGIIGLSDVRSWALDSERMKGDGNFLLETCNAAVRSMDGDTSTATALYAYICFGYMAGFEHGQSITVFQNRYDRKDSNVAFVFCSMQRDINAYQKARVVNKWLQEHPQLLHLSPDILTYTALATAFPCSGSDMKHPR